MMVSSKCLDEEQERELEEEKEEEKEVQQKILICLLNHLDYDNGFKIIGSLNSNEICFLCGKR